MLVCYCFAKKDDVNVNFLKSFDNEEQEYTEECFGLDSQLVLLYKNTESAEKVGEYVAWLEKRDDVSAVQDYSNTLGKQLTAQEAAVSLGFDEQQAQMMFGMLGKETMNIEELLAAAEQMLHVIWRVLFALPKSLSGVLYRLFHFGNHTFVSRSGSRRDR